MSSTDPSSSRLSSRASSPRRPSLAPSGGLRPVLSTTSLKAKARSAPGTPSTVPPSALPPHLTVPQAAGIESSASSIINMSMDVGEGILVAGSEADVDMGDGDEATAVGHIEPSGDDETRKNLRDQLRRTLTRTGEASPAPTISKRTGTLLSPEDSELHIRPDEYKPRQYFVLTDAGKPVFTSHAAEHRDDLTSITGVIQAIISVFIDDGDKIRCINAGATRITFLLRSPLYYVCVSNWKEPESVTRSHLEYLHLQILSVISGGQLKRIFERRTNFDLGRLLSGTETVLNRLLERLQEDIAVSMSSLHCLKLELPLRSKAAHTLVPASKMKDLLYIMLVARGRVITLLRPKKHSVHPGDLHIILNTVHAPSVLDSPASWLPICLPKYNQAGFVHAYVNFIRNGDLNDAPSPTPSPVEESATYAHAHRENSTAEGEEEAKGSTAETAADTTSECVGDAAETATIVDKRSTQSNADSLKADRAGRFGLGLVCISGGGEMEHVRQWADAAAAKLESDGTIHAICKAVREGYVDYSVSELGIPGLRHFVYKSRPQVQVTYPAFEDPYDDESSRRRLIMLYQTLHDAIHAKSGQQGPLKLQYIKTTNESVMGWITQPFELYLSVSARLPKSAAISAANAIMKWVKREEGRLFLKDAPTF